MNVQGAAGRAGARPGDHVQVPRGMEHRHGGGGGHRGRHGCPWRAGHPSTCSRSRFAVAIAVPTTARRFLPFPSVPAPARAGAGAAHRGQARLLPAQPAHRMDRTPDPAHRPVRALHDLHRRDRQRLAEPRGHRRLSHVPAALGTLTFAVFPGGDDRRPLVRPRLHRPVRPGPGPACLRRHRPHRPAHDRGRWAAAGRAGWGGADGAWDVPGVSCRYQRRRRTEHLGMHPAGSAPPPRSATWPSSPGLRPSASSPTTSASCAACPSLARYSPAPSSSAPSPHRSARPTQ